MNQITVGVITVSDRASQGIYDDLGGPALKEAVQRVRVANSRGSDRPRRYWTHPGDHPILFCARVRSDPDHRGNGSRTSGRDTGSDSCRDARRIARIRRSDARRVAETDAQRHFVTFSGCHRRPITCHCPAG